MALPPSNPFLVDVILDHLMAFVLIDNECFKSCRLVSKQWKESASRLFSRTTVKRLGVFGKLQIKDPYKEYEKHLVKSFIDGMGMFNYELRIAKYEVGLDFFIEHKLLFQSFKNVCVPGATELVFYLDVNDKVNFNWRKKKFKLQSLKCLKAFKLVCRVWSNEKEDETSTIQVFDFLTEFLEKQTCLTSFEFNILEYYRETTYWTEEILRKFNVNVCGKLPRSITNLRFDIPATEDMFETLQQKNLPLCSLSVVMGSNQSSSLAALKILMSSNNSKELLQRLCLKMLAENDDMYLSFFGSTDVKLKKLMFLSLKGLASVGTFSYSNMPALEDIDLLAWESKAALLKILPGWEKANSVKRLCLPHGFPQSVNISLLKDGYPCLQSLTLTCPDIVATLKKAFIHLVRLESLCVYLPKKITEKGFASIDSVLSGVPSYYVRRISGSYMKDFKMENILQLQKNPSLLQLKRLRKFSLYCTLPDSKNMVATDFAAYFVFTQMKTLSELHLPLTGGVLADWRPFSEDGLRMMRNHAVLFASDVPLDPWNELTWTSKKLKAAMNHRRRKIKRSVRCHRQVAKARELKSV